MKPFTTIVLNSHLPRNFREIHLELAREKQHPHGEPAIGYTLIVPLDDDGRIDVDAWKIHRDACRVIRLRPNQESVAGQVIRRPGGTWALQYNPDGDEASTIGNEVGYHFNEECFVPGEYVSIKEADREHTYIVRSVRPLA